MTTTISMFNYYFYKALLFIYYWEWSRQECIINDVRDSSLISWTKILRRKKAMGPSVLMERLPQVGAEAAQPL